MRTDEIRICPADASGQRKGRAGEEWVAMEILARTRNSQAWLAALKSGMGAPSTSHFDSASVIAGNGKADVMARIASTSADGQVSLALAGFSVKTFNPEGEVRRRGGHLHRSTIASGESKRVFPSWSAHPELHGLLARWALKNAPILEWSAEEQASMLALMEPRWDAMVGAALWAQDAGVLPCEGMLLIDARPKGSWHEVHGSVFAPASLVDRMRRKTRKPLSIDSLNGGSITDGLFSLQRGTDDLQWKFDVVSLYALFSQ